MNYCTQFFLSIPVMFFIEGKLKNISLWVILTMHVDLNINLHYNAYFMDFQLQFFVISGYKDCLLVVLRLVLCIPYGDLCHLGCLI